MKPLIVSTSPHIARADTVNTVMRDVIIALTPAMLYSVYVFGMNALFILAATAGSAMLFEWVSRRLMNRPVNLGDMSAILTGLLLAMNLPPSIPWWIAVAGSFVAIVIAKELAGGLGHNIFNPALVGRAFVHISWSGAMAVYLVPYWWREAGGFFSFATMHFNDSVPALMSGGTVLDTVSGATPLMIVKPSLESTEVVPALSDLFLGGIGGSLGETSALALLIGGLYLIWRDRIDWRVPATFIATVGLFSLILGADPFYHILAGGVMLGAFFMLTDYVTAPVTPVGRIVFAAGAGILTVLMRQVGGFPEGVAYAILFMNALVPLIDKWIKTSALGRAT